MIYARFLDFFPSAVATWFVWFTLVLCIQDFVLELAGKGLERDMMETLLLQVLWKPLEGDTMTPLVLLLEVCLTIGIIFIMLDHLYE